MPQSKSFFWKKKIKNNLRAVYEQVNQVIFGLTSQRKVWFPAAVKKLLVPFDPSWKNTLCLSAGAYRHFLLTHKLFI
jgi:hypothetical protein